MLFDSFSPKPNLMHDGVQTVLMKEDFSGTESDVTEK